MPFKRATDLQIQGRTRDESSSLLPLKHQEFTLIGSDVRSDFKEGTGRKKLNAIEKKRPTYGLAVHFLFVELRPRIHLVLEASESQVAPPVGAQ